ncbi:serine/threonine-protein kinase/endoribonuclease ire-1-like [Xenia sp. Carnegie-2017]|uniref:serine/threonine-protein kinase/endoribonuclease ire-1-like n=1 Tax=Xenia sp. Carnegie-2017 TaxID=2897299 RepID=UPI001F0428D0|nr:serine/threonine-protein kinase/endoribonuclease ire-1-like [Xenia sp. Carnegie-2017]
MILKLIEYGGKIPNVEVKDMNGVRVIFSEAFCLGCGNNGTRVYLGLGKDGYGKAVKRILRDEGINLAHKENKILNELRAKESKFVVNYHYLEEDNGTEYVYLILDLCEESLEDFVQSESNSLAYLQKSLPEILRHILKGLSDLHSGKNPILHRDLKPFNVFRDAQGKFLIADFGISRILKDGSKTRVSNAKKGTPHWIAPESFCTDKNQNGKGRYKTESDVMTAGMVAFYVATKGDHPFKSEENILKGNPVCLDEIKDATFKDLLSWMLYLKTGHLPTKS